MAGAHDEELEAFKTGIDLRFYAASLGFAYDKAKSARRSAIMKRGGDKIVIKLNAGDRHFVYFTVHDDKDNGSIIDFVMRRQGISNFGEIRKELRPWIGRRPSLPLPALPRLEESSKDRGAVEAEFEGIKEALRHPYLENVRGLPAALLSSARFKGCVRIDARHNAVFPHADQEGLCGFEKKNRNFTGFARSGEKALWFSRCRTGDAGLVFCESGIEALSHAALFAAPAARYASIGGEMSDKQLDLIRAAALKMPGAAEIIAAFNADADGRKYAEKVRSIIEGLHRKDLRFTLHEPSGFKDWNDQLCGRSLLSFPTARFDLS